MKMTKPIKILIFIATILLLLEAILLCVSDLFHLNLIKYANMLCVLLLFDICIISVIMVYNFLFVYEHK